MLPLQVVSTSLILNSAIRNNFFVWSDSLIRLVLVLSIINILDDLAGYILMTAWERFESQMHLSNSHFGDTLRDKEHVELSMLVCIDAETAISRYPGCSLAAWAQVQTPWAAGERQAVLLL